jgi:hypothetical protein
MLQCLTNHVRQSRGEGALALSRRMRRTARPQLHGSTGARCATRALEDAVGSDAGGRVPLLTPATQTEGL